MTENTEALRLRMVAPLDMDEAAGRWRRPDCWFR